MVTGLGIALCWCAKTGRVVARLGRWCLLERFPWPPRLRLRLVLGVVLGDGSEKVKGVEST